MNTDTFFLTDAVRTRLARGVMCKRELCRVVKVGRHTEKGKNGGNKVVRCCYASQAQGDRDEKVSKVSVAMVDESAESPPQERRNNPGSHADLAGCGGETEADGQGRRGSRRVLPVVLGGESLPLQLLPQGMSPTVGVNPIHGCEYYCFTAELLQHPEIRVYDLLDGVRITEFWDVIGLSSHK